MKTINYSMAFTTGSLLHNDSLKIASLFLASGSWKDVSAKAVKDNILQSRTLSSSKKITVEICSRLKLLNKKELQLLIKGTSQEQAFILWVAICRKYKFIYEFAVEVVRENFLSFQYELTYSDYDTFFNSKASWNEQLAHIADSTKAKARQVIFRMLREANLLNTKNMINPVILSSIIIEAITSKSQKDLRLFPINETDLVDWLK
jgi:hypothetical protein